MRRVMAVGVAVLFGLSACSSSTPSASPSRTPTASMTTSASPSASPSATPTPTPPVMPELAKQHTAEGAQAFVQYWFDTGTYAVLSGDTAPIRSVSLDNCKACSGVIDQVQEQYALGGRFIDFSAKIRSPAAAPPDSQGVVVTLGLDESALVGVAPDGARSTLAPADSTDSVTFFAQWVDGHWSAYEIAKD